MSASSGLRLYMNGVAMTSTNGGTCAKWKFLYNGGACPEANHDINGLYLQAHTYQHMMPISVSGICRGLGAGNLAITLDCESCANRQIINPVTGWETTLSVTAEEVELA
ncbi:collagen triple helix repeat-containing protein 1 [Lingula anatina]|uniref:Collagen triple helix repeat-containing protein 1 n=1 Tax=Lingula anatina TaxID=7574 RepID=A0A1S3IRB1_LINAN|nr:collagen triple helix repeat-containing protein 1 [Lingula anatina]|eukprot:XP_013400608.1 collagen triple helix repeat-containing protein 1 [Lingula anatina]